jgi:hypothetical protein
LQEFSQQVEILLLHSPFHIFAAELFSTAAQSIKSSARRGYERPQRMGPIGTAVSENAG